MDRCGYLFETLPITLAESCDDLLGGPDAFQPVTKPVPRVPESKQGGAREGRIAETSQTPANKG
jgi:hypothetical protein